ncbi:gloverin-like [Bombyx mandarina]|uniref:Gloverin3 n=2 Tax=Bombyx TaxID=7090 RepID=A5LHW4_BOMMO|nr:gloverin 3 precursor [Bombyx mori]XP_028030686.1 gloverin-like [Bombyx mandarina]BAF63527.1 gloverin3 [Bombyx mori]
MNSKLLFFIATVLVCVNAEVYRSSDYEKEYPIRGLFSKRHPRDVTWDTRMGGGKVFGTLGQNDDGLFGKAGYNREIFNDDRGQLTGQAYGTRVLGPGGDSTNYGGRLDWANKNAQAAIDINRQIGGRSGMTASGSGVWDLDKNTHISAGGMVSKEFGHRRPDVGLQAEIRHEW